MADLLVAHWLPPVLLAPFVGVLLGAVIEPLAAGRKPFGARPVCAACGHPLGVRDLIPLASWVSTRGRCRYCSDATGVFHPAIEVMAVVTAVWAAVVLSGWLVWASSILGWMLLALAAIDQRRQVLVDGLTLPLIPAGVAVAYMVGPANVTGHIAGAVLGFAGFAAIGWLYRAVRGREGLGLGDAKLLAGAGAWVSWTGLPSVVLIAASSALIVVLSRALAGRGVSLVQRLPFGPYLCFGTWVVWLYGPVAISW